MGKSSKKKPTNRDRDFALTSHANAINGLQAQVSELFQLLASYIEYKGDTDELTNFLTKKAKEKAEKEQAPKIVDSAGKTIASNS
tara:strand:+ start:320 stop:574 length:255 start_codon:yes stop_codon:yes gene_type:complete